MTHKKVVGGKTVQVYSSSSESSEDPTQRNWGKLGQKNKKKQSSEEEEGGYDSYSENDDYGYGEYYDEEEEDSEEVLLSFDTVLKKSKNNQP